MPFWWVSPIGKRSASTSSNSSCATRGRSTPSSRTFPRFSSATRASSPLTESPSTCPFWKPATSLPGNRAALKGRLHLDLLHPARRLWKWRLDSCSLGSLEQRILGARRSEADVPGYLIPQLYNTFLRDGNPAPLQGIFYHNHQDLLALAALAVHMVRLCADPEHQTIPHGQDLYALARLYDESGHSDEAERCYRRALTAPIPRSLRHECVGRLSLLLKRHQRWDEAAELWRSLLDLGFLYPYVELAKYHEHQTRNFPAAERAILAALAADLLLTRSDYDQLHHRLERVRHKQRRATA